MLKNIKLIKTPIKEGIMMTLFAMFMVMFASTATAVQSLRGDSALDAKANKVAKHKINTQEGGYERNYKLQPPLGPHKVDKYRVTIKNNGCLKCHSEKSYKKEKAPKVADSHYIDRDGKVLKTISKRRYFCNQCHTPQVKSNPLVENVYEGVD